MRQLFNIRAISTLETNICNRLRLREYDRRSTRQQKNEIKNKMKALEECAKNSRDEIKNFEDENGDSSRFKDDITGPQKKNCRFWDGDYTFLLYFFPPNPNPASKVGG